MVTSTAQPEINSEEMMNFAHKVVGDLAAAMSGPLLYIGDRLGLFKALAQAGPVTVEKFAADGGFNERYVREWAAAMVAAEYLKYDPQTRAISLPPEHAMVLAHADSPLFTGGLAQMIPDQYRVMPRVMESFKAGGGVPYSDYS
ncbi:MAG: class I SAM-dependent methyltransferase, partial [Candidatus Dormibacteraceae bacterium]